mmetsp:Transcript_33834/g.46299  ORF Transcript_33834/g.46299 Transcript_33834/m.46299 type:complete len:289 (+) Transcript_33834:115-981(+)
MAVQRAILGSRGFMGIGGILKNAQSPFFNRSFSPSFLSSSSVGLLNLQAPCSFCRETKSFEGIFNQNRNSIAFYHTTQPSWADSSSIFDEALDELETLDEDKKKRDDTEKTEKTEQEKKKNTKAFAFNPQCRTTFKKMNLVARLVRGVSYREAVAQLTFSPLKPAKILLEIMNSARANAEHQYNLDPDRLLVSEILTGRGGGTLKRITYHGRGRHGQRWRRRTYVKVILEEIPQSDSEIRLGRYGRKNKTLEKDKERLSQVTAQRIRERQEQEREQEQERGQEQGQEQ